MSSSKAELGKRRGRAAVCILVLGLIPFSCSEAGPETAANAECFSDSDCPTGYPCILADADASTTVPGHCSSVCIGPTCIHIRKPCRTNCTECAQDSDCAPGHRCLLESDGGSPDPAAAKQLDASADAAAGADAGPSATTPDTAQTPDSSVATAAHAPGLCEKSCEDELCPARQECTSYGDCLPVDCGRSVDCPASDTPLYCDVKGETCHRLDGQCDDANGYQCPTLVGTLPAGISVACVPARTGGKRCAFLAVNATPWFGPDVSADARFVAPENGHVFQPSDAIAFTISNLRAPSFLVVTMGRALDLDQIQSQAVWAASIRRPSSSAQRQTVRWSDGSQVQDGTWLPAPGTPPLDVDLYATLLEVDGNVVIATTPAPLAFRVGTPWATAGSGCSTDAGATGFCDNPTQFLACVDDVCHELCLSDLDCPGSHSCRLIRESGLRYCD